MSVEISIHQVTDIELETKTIRDTVWTYINAYSESYNNEKTVTTVVLFQKNKEALPIDLQKAKTKTTAFLLYTESLAGEVSNTGIEVFSSLEKAKDHVIILYEYAQLPKEIQDQNLEWVEQE